MRQRQEVLSPLLSDRGGGEREEDRALLLFVSVPCEEEEDDVRLSHRLRSLQLTTGHWWTQNTHTHTHRCRPLTRAWRCDIPSGFSRTNKRKGLSGLSCPLLFGGRTVGSDASRQTQVLQASDNRKYFHSCTQEQEMEGWGCR